MFITKCRHDGLENTYEKLREYVLAHLDARKTAKMTEQAKGGGTQKAHAGKGTSKGGPNPKAKAAARTPPSVARRELGDCFKYLETGRCAGKDNGTCPYKHVSTKVGPKGKGVHAQGKCTPRRMHELLFKSQMLLISSAQYARTQGLNMS